MEGSNEEYYTMDGWFYDSVKPAELDLTEHVPISDERHPNYVECDKEYRILEPGELVKNGDQCQSRRHPREWHESHRVGRQAEEFKYRRRID